MSKLIVTTEIELEQLIQASVRKAFDEQSPPSQDQESSYLSVSEASKLLNLAKQTIYGLTSKRMIPVLKRGKKLYFKKSDLLAWLEAGRKQSLKELQSISSSIFKQTDHGK